MDNRSWQFAQCDPKEILKEKKPVRGDSLREEEQGDLLWTEEEIVKEEKPEKRQEKEDRERNNLKNSNKKERKGETGKEGGVMVRHTRESRNIQRLKEMEDTGGW